MSDIQWALKSPSGYFLPTQWRRADALQKTFEMCGGETHQGPRHNWWRRMKRQGWSVVKLELGEVSHDD